MLIFPGNLQKAKHSCKTKPNLQCCLETIKCKATGPQRLCAVVSQEHSTSISRQAAVAVLLLCVWRTGGKSLDSSDSPLLYTMLKFFSNPPLIPLHRDTVKYKQRLIPFCLFSRHLFIDIHVFIHAHTHRKGYILGTMLDEKPD